MSHSILIGATIDKRNQNSVNNDIILDRAGKETNIQSMSIIERTGVRDTHKEVQTTTMIVLKTGTENKVIVQGAPLRPEDQYCVPVGLKK